MEFVGVDGCPAGWVAVALDVEGRATYRVAAEFAEIAAALPRALFLVDIPIGLRDEGPLERLCDAAARAVLGPRRSSIFSPPCRSALGLARYEDGSAENRRRTGRRLTKQSWALVPKIRQVDDHLRLRGLVGAVIREMHPEVCFWGLADHPMAHPKRRAEGRAERLAVLSAHFPRAEGFLADLRGKVARSAVCDDDVLDALVGAVTGWLGPERLCTLPEVPEMDGRGLRMEIVYTRGSVIP